MPKEKIRLSDSNTGKMLVVQTTSESLDKNVELILPLGGKLITKDVMLEHIDGLIDGIVNIKKPVLSYPTNNEIDFDGLITMSSYSTSDMFVGEHTNTVIQIARDVDFTDLVINSRLGGVEIYLPTTLEPVNTYYIRAMYVSNDIESAWSDVVKFTTINDKVSRPTLTISGDNINNVDDGALLTASEFISIDSNEDHISTTWQLLDPNTFEVVWESVNDTTHLLKINIPRGVLEVSRNYIARVNLKGNINGNSPAGTVLFKTRNEFMFVGSDENQYVESSYNGVDYFGEVVIDQLDGTYNYRGEWGINSGRPDKDYTKDEQVTYNSVLYRCLKTHANVTPGTDATAWVVDVRNNLPTGKWILDQVGIGYGLTDNNVDGRSSGSIKLGNLKNNDQGWLKFVYNGKLIYIAKKPFVDTIAWTDIAKREAESGKRTIRIGKHLYYVRLVKQDEYVNCLLNATNGNLASLDCSVVEKTWIHDTTEGANRKVMSNSNVVSTLPTISRTGSYRPVLEYIPEGQEPYNNIKSGIPTATNENFQYDFYTDTGYFGHVPATSLIGGNSLATTVGLTVGFAQNDTTGYFKFYWHGQILYVCKQTIRHTTSWNHINSANCVFGKDMGGSGKKTITVGSNTYAVQLLLGAGKSPVDDELYWSDFIPTDEAVFKRNVKDELARGSQWNDLMYRVHTVIPSNRWIDQTDGDDKYRNTTGGVQIGKNWANYTNAEMSVFIVEGGDGAGSWCQEVSQRYGIEANTNRGSYHLTDLHASGPSFAVIAVGSRFSLRLL